MSLEIKYLGNLGNNLFQYCTSIIYCTNNNLFLESKISKKCYFLKINPYSQPKNLEQFVRFKQILIKDQNFDKSICDFPYHGCRRYKFRGYFQNTLYLNKNEDIVLNIFSDLRKEYIKNINNDDILVLIRLGDDFFHEATDSEVIDPEYYLNILDKETFNKCYIYIYPLEEEYSQIYLKFFEKYNPIIIPQSQNPLENFTIPLRFNKIVCSNSTFHWWGCFISDASKIYIPKLFGYFGTNDNIRSHNSYYYEITNIRNMSIPINNKFIEREDLKSRAIVG